MHKKLLQQNSFYFFTLSLFVFFLLTKMHANEIPITLEIAQTSEQRSWGLMQRTSMPENHGMLFYFPNGSIWMFNTFIDLSVAFLDVKGKIIEIAELKAYPDMMDPYRPVNTLNDIKKYSPYDKVIQFFANKSHRVPKDAAYALEMNKTWFARMGVGIGDRVIWNEDSLTGCVRKKAKNKKN